jgi:hypothetical protein
MGRFSPSVEISILDVKFVTISDYLANSGTIFRYV